MFERPFWSSRSRIESRLIAVFIAVVAIAGLTTLPH